LTGAPQHQRQGADQQTVVGTSDFDGVPLAIRATRNAPRLRGHDVSFVLIAIALALPIQPTFAADPAPADAREKLEMRKQELDATQARAKFIQGDLVEIKQEREKLNAKLLETAALIQKGEGRLTGIEGKLIEMEKQEGVLRADLERNHDKIAKLMAALQRMGRNPPPVLFTQRQDALQMVRSAMLLAHAFPELRGDALKLATKLTELINISSGIRTERDGLKVETTRLADARTRLSGLLETKKQNLTERQDELAKVRMAAAEISKNVNDLNELIGKLDQAVTANTALGAYNAEIEKAANAPAPAVEVAVTVPAATAPTAKVPATAPATKPGEKNQEVAAVLPPPLKPSMIELKPAAAGSGSLGPMKPVIAFSAAKTRLPLPAAGRRVLAFGDKTQYGGQSKGIVLETRHGAQITAPCDGWIVYAGEFRSYGQLLIINAGGGYHVLLAGLSQIDVQPGQFVLASEPVGVMTGAATQANPLITPGPQSKTNQPVLYVEFRKDGRPIDPDPWWVEGHQKVQG
jgi:murein hydrolase activator